MYDSKAIVLPPGMKRTEETVWRAWLDRNRTQETHRQHRRETVFSIVLIGAFVVAALLGSGAVEYSTAVSAALAIGAAIAAFHALNAGRYVAATLFACMAVIYNPGYPLLALSGAFATVTLLGSAALLAMPLVFNGR
jgi:hypothetical protein